MDSVKGALLALVIVLAGACFLFYVQASTARAQLSDASATNKLTLDMLRAQGVPCSALPSDFIKVGKCVAPLLQAKDFKEDGFAQPSDARGTSGYLVIKNVNSRAYNSSAFTFSFNRQVVQQGCLIPGDIGKNVACRFDFPDVCQEGYVLEVNYTADNRSTKVFTKIC